MWLCSPKATVSKPASSTIRATTPGASPWSEHEVAIPTSTAQLYDARSSSTVTRAVRTTRSRGPAFARWRARRRLRTLEGENASEGARAPGPRRAEREECRMDVEHLMTRDVVTVSPETPLKEVAAILADRGISGLPVCGAGGEVLGVVSEADILHKERGLPRGRASVFDWLFARSDEDANKLAARTAGEAMTAPAITIDAGRPVAEAAALMLDRGINRLPVVHAGELVGIVTRADLVRAFRRSDEEIAREIRQDV